MGRDEFNYRFADAHAAHVFVGLSVHGKAEGGAMVQLLQAQGLAAIDLTDNEMAKLHIRHLVGGVHPRDLLGYLAVLETIIKNAR